MNKQGVVQNVERALESKDLDHACDCVGSSGCAVGIRLPVDNIRESQGMPFLEVNAPGASYGEIRAGCDGAGRAPNITASPTMQMSTEHHCRRRRPRRIGRRSRISCVVPTLWRRSWRKSNADLDLDMQPRIRYSTQWLCNGELETTAETLKSPTGVRDKHDRRG